MSKVRIVKTSFVSGEIAKQVFGRIDKDFYANGADKLRNVYVDPLGGVYRREGMRIIDQTLGDTVFDNRRGRLVEISFNSEQTYLFVLTRGAISVYKDDVFVNTIYLGQISEDNLFEIRYAQYADTVIFVHKSFKPFKVVRHNDGFWWYTPFDIDFIPLYGFNGINTVYPNNVLTFDNLVGKNINITVEGGVFNSGHVNQLISGRTGGVFRITQFIDGSRVIGDAIVDFPGDDDTTQDNNGSTYESGDWALETGYELVWSDARGHPSTCCFYQGRLWFGGSGSRPTTIWASKVDDFFNFDTGGGKADDAIDVTINDEKINTILNIFPGRNLQIFTTGGEFYIPQTETDPIKPENIMLQKSTFHGSSKVKPISVDGSTIFVEASGRVVREFTFNELERSYNAKSISLLSSQLINSPVAMAIRQSRGDSPADYVYIVNTDGTVAVLNILRSEQLLAWSLFETQGIVEDVAVIARQVYFITTRIVNGVRKRFIEKLDKDYYLDGSIKSITASPAFVHTGFSKLASQDVKVKASGFVLEDNKIDENGSLTIGLDYKNVEVGYGFNVLVRLLPIDVNLGVKTLSGDWRRLVYILIKTTKSNSFSIKCGNNIFRPAFRSLGSKVLDQPVSQYNGWKKIFLSGGVSRDATIDIVQNEPMDFDLTTIVLAVTI
jgi:hypothetical protein